MLFFISTILVTTGLTAVAKTVPSDDKACSVDGEDANQRGGHRAMIHRHSVRELSHGSELLLEPNTSTKGLPTDGLHQIYEDLDSFLTTGGFPGDLIEGHINSDIDALKQQTSKYDEWASTLNLKTICETGFNAGHSALRFLAQTEAKVYEFDWCEHNYSKPAAEYLNTKYPGRLTLVCGDSTDSIPEFMSRYPDVKCDLFIVDGSVSADVAKADLTNFAKMSAENALVTIDDTPCDAHWWCDGPTEAWNKFVADGCVEDEQSIPMGDARGFSYGKLKTCNSFQLTAETSNSENEAENGESEENGSGEATADDADSASSKHSTKKMNKHKLWHLFAQLDKHLEEGGYPCCDTDDHTRVDVDAFRLQTSKYDEWASSGKFKTICETGFNAGHSALRFLSQTEAKVYEFDLCIHKYSKPAAEYLNSRYPDRLTLVCGDSEKTLPEFVQKYSDIKCDLLIIDGGVSAEVAKSDLYHLAKIASENAVVAIDDTPCEAHWWCDGRTEAWTKFVADGCIEGEQKVPMGDARGFSYGNLKSCDALQQ